MRLAGALVLALVLLASTPIQASAHSSPRAPSGGTLASGSSLTDGLSAAEEASSSAPASGGDPLAGNGLSSPLCSDARVTGLAGAAARNCAVSKFEASPAPTGDYAFDVHIDTGVAKLGNDISVTFQDVFQLGWTAFVAIMHGLIVMLDWCFTLDLLNGPAMGGLARGLRATQATFTQPWLALVLAIAAVLALYHGLIRRRVAETLGEALLTVAMMAGGLWTIANPAGTVGALAGWANEASLGTFAAVAAGTPAHSGRTLAESTQGLFRVAVYGPWCYLEFGDESWCANPARLDPRLRAAALKLAGREGAAHAGSATLLRQAQTNGDLFLALPANEVARNSIHTAGSLYQVLCGGEEEPCRGPTAGEAEFRTQSGTWPRFIGLLLIWLGAMGMLLVLGFIALRLLEAALTSLIYLLLAPAAVLAPAFGEGGRNAFRGWATRLLGAVAAKLVFSFLLGAVLSAERLLASVPLLGWWTRWLLISALWWGAFRHRHKALDFSHSERPSKRRSIARQAREALETPRTALRGASWARQKLTRSAPDVKKRDEIARAGEQLASERADSQAGQSLEHQHRDARALLDEAPERQARLTGIRGQLARVRGAREEALVVGDTRRAASLGARGQRLTEALTREEGELVWARRAVDAGERAERRTGEPHTREQRGEYGRLLDTQAALPARGRADGRGRRRDYAALAGLAGFGRQEYERLDPRRRREARLQIDRELAMRKELGGAAADVAAAVAAPGRAERRRAGKELERTLGVRLRTEGQRRPNAPGASAQIEAWKRVGAAEQARTRTGSPVLDDALEVAAGRKRQLGRDRP
jgi:hypothetical protein